MLDSILEQKTKNILSACNYLSNQKVLNSNLSSAIIPIFLSVIQMLIIYILIIQIFLLIRPISIEQKFCLGPTTALVKASATI